MRAPAIRWHAGGAGDEVLLLLNGWSASGVVWPRAWVARLEERFLVIRPDNRGSGWSRTAPRPFTVGTMADDAHAVLLAAGATRARVLGLSMGGMIAQEFAIRHPDAVEALVLAGTRPPAPAARIDDVTLLMGALRGPAEGERSVDFFRRTWRDYMAPGFADAHPEVVEELVTQIARRATPRRGVLDQVRAMSSWGGARRLAQITAPTTVVHGDLDPLIPTVNGRILSELVPGARYVELPGVGHLLPYEAGQVLIDAIAHEGVASPVAR